MESGAQAQIYEVGSLRNSLSIDPMSDQHLQPLERRPISARQWPVSQIAAGWLARRGISPNSISIAGMVFGIAAGFAFSFTREQVEDSHWLFLVGATLLLLRLMANMLDGMVAIEGGRRSVIGELYNEIPDRISDATTLIGFGYSVGGNPVLGYVAACIALFVAYVRAQGKALGAPNDFCGPMAKQQRMAIVILIGIICTFAPMDWQLTMISKDCGLPSLGLWVIIIGGSFTALRRLNRIASHLRNRSL